MLCVSLDEIGHMVLKCSCFIFVTQLLSPFNKGFDYSLKKKLESPAFKIFISLFLLFFFWPSLVVVGPVVLEMVMVRILYDGSDNHDGNDGQTDKFRLKTAHLSPRLK